MILGFIGTGKITTSVIKGICKSKIKYKKIIISPRNKKNANYLKRSFKNIKIAKNNQEVVELSNWIFLAITPSVGEKIIKNLKFRSNQMIISFISTLSISTLKKMISVKAEIVRAIPLPPISLKKGPVPICPPNKKVKNFFDKIGDCIEIKNENLSLNFWAASSLMAPYYELLNNVSKWVQKKGVDKIKSQKYVTSLFLALSENALSNSNKDLNILVKHSQTPKGLNEQTLRFLKKKKFYKSLNVSLNKIVSRLK